MKPKMARARKERFAPSRSRDVRGVDNYLVEETKGAIRIWPRDRDRPSFAYWLWMALLGVAIAWLTYASYRYQHDPLRPVGPWGDLGRDASDVGVGSVISAFTTGGVLICLWSYIYFGRGVSLANCFPTRSLLTIAKPGGKNKGGSDGPSTDSVEVDGTTWPRSTIVGILHLPPPDAERGAGHRGEGTLRGSFRGRLIVAFVDADGRRTGRYLRYLPGADNYDHDTVPFLLERSLGLRLVDQGSLDTLLFMLGIFIPLPFGVALFFAATHCWFAGVLVWLAAALLGELLARRHARQLKTELEALIPEQSDGPHYIEKPPALEGPAFARWVRRSLGLPKKGSRDR